MIVKTRTTAQGTEYWDNKEKRVRFVPNGKKPKFDVTENPDSLIGDESESASTREPGDGDNLEDMTVKQLIAFAAELEIEIPKDITKKDDMVAFLSDSE